MQTRRYKRAWETAAATLLLLAVGATAGGAWQWSARQKHLRREMQAAALNKDTPRLLALVRQGAPFRNVCPMWPPLFVAAEKGDLTLATELLDRGADPNETGSFDCIDCGWGGSWTPLIVAAYGADARMVRLLVDRGADVNAVGDSGDTALRWAAWYGNEENIRLLVSRGADPNRRTNATRQTALSLARWAGRRKIVTLLRTLRAAEGPARPNLSRGPGFPL